MSFTPDQLVQLGIAVALAAIPAAIWFILLFSGRKTSRKPLVLAFFLGTLTVLPIIALDYIWVFFPEYDIFSVIEKNITDVHYAAFASLIFVGITEELVKSGVVRIIDKTKFGLNTVNDAVKYSVLAGLGFAFTENIFYFYFIWQSSGFAGLILPMIFRSIFTVCAHMVFSGIFGYFYGLAKFAKPIVEAKDWLGEQNPAIQFLAKILRTEKSNAYGQWMVLKGLLIAMILHTFFNFFLEFEYLIPTITLVGGGFAYLLYLLAHKAGAIAFAGAGRESNMAAKDEDVVLELLGMWTQEGRYKDVVDICQRLLMRDPDNKVVKLFQAKAMDAQKLSNLETSMMSLFSSDEKTEKDDSLRTLVKQKVLMEMLKEKQQALPAAAPQNIPVPNAAPVAPAPQPAQGVALPTAAPVPSPAPVQSDPSSQPSSPAPAPAPVPAPSSEQTAPSPQPAPVETAPQPVDAGTIVSSETPSVADSTPQTPEQNPPAAPQ